MSFEGRTVAFLFAGQGSQTPGMGAALASVCSGCRAMFAVADDAVGYPLSRVMADGPAERLRRTAVAQPALLTLAIAQARHLEALGVRPAMAAGHSLGQYTALVFAGAIAYEDAVRLVALRGELMQQTVPEGRGAMAAVVGLEREEVEGACARASEAVGTVDVSCVNAPGRLVIGGAVDAVEAASQECEDLGGTVIPLEVSAPFHCALLAPMVPRFREALDRVDFRRPGIPVVDNVTGTPLWEPDEIRASLVRHLQAPVLFAQSLAYLGEHGIRTVVQCGPGASLLGFAKKSIAGARCLEFEHACAECGEGLVHAA